MANRSTTENGTSLQDAASGIADEASRTAEVTASRGMDQAADMLEQVAQSFRSAQSDLRSQQPQVASVMDTALRQVDSAAAYLRQHEPADVLGRAQSIARQQPALVIGGGLVIGLMLGRVLRTAATPQQQQGSDWSTYRTNQMDASWPPQQGSPAYSGSSAGTNGGGYNGAGYSSADYDTSVEPSLATSSTTIERG